MSQGKAVVTDRAPAQFLQGLKNLGYQVQVEEKLSQADLISAIRDAKLLVMYSGVSLTEDELEHALYLEHILRPGSGLDNIDVVAAQQRGISVISLA